MREIRELQAAMERKKLPPRHTNALIDIERTQDNRQSSRNDASIEKPDFSRLETQSLMEHSAGRAMSTISGHNIGSSNHSVAGIGTHRAT